METILHYHPLCSSESRCGYSVYDFASKTGSPFVQQSIVMHNADMSALLDAPTDKGLVLWPDKTLRIDVRV